VLKSVRYQIVNFCFGGEGIEPEAYAVGEREIHKIHSVSFYLSVVPHDDSICVVL
jgi:hypothetical protein